jgi:hypothetical protein
MDTIIFNGKEYALQKEEALIKKLKGSKGKKIVPKLVSIFLKTKSCKKDRHDA